MTYNENEEKTTILNQPHASLRDLTTRIDNEDEEKREEPISVRDLALKIEKESNDLSTRLYQLNKALRQLVIATEHVESMIGKTQDNSDNLIDLIGDINFEIRKRRIF